MVISEISVYFEVLFWSSPIFKPGPAVQFLCPIIPLLLSDVPVVVRNPIRIQSRSVLPLVPALRSDPSVDDGVEAVDSLWTKIPRQRLGQHPLGCLGGRKTHCDRLPPKSSSGSSDGNHSLPPRGHLGPNVLCHGEKAVHVRLHRHLQLLVGHVLVRCPNSKARIMHDSVDLSQLLLNCGQSSREGNRVGHVSSHSQRARVLRGCCFELTGGSAHHRHLVALFDPLPHTGHPQSRANSDHNTNTPCHSCRPEKPMYDHD